MEHLGTPGYDPTELSELPNDAEQSEAPAPERFYTASQAYHELAQQSGVDLAKLTSIIYDMRDTVKPYAESFSQSSNPAELKAAADSIDFMGHQIGEIIDGMSAEDRAQYSYDCLQSMAHLNDSRFRLRQQARRLERDRQKNG